MTTDHIETPSDNFDVGIDSTTAPQAPATAGDGAVVVDQSQPSMLAETAPAPAAASVPLARKHRAPDPIVAAPCADEGNSAPDFAHLLPAWIVSGVVHVLLLLTFLLIKVGDSPGSVQTQLNDMENRIDEEVRCKSLLGADIGNDPDLPTSYNVERIEEVSVPGPVQSEEATGIPGAPVAPPSIVPPPPGLGGPGSGGSLDDPSKTGSGSRVGTPGGYGLGKFVPGGFGGRSGATREQLLREGGGNTESEAAVAAGLIWLAQHQGDDGRWGLHDFHKLGKCACSMPGMHNDAAATGLGLLPFLGAGESHRPGSKNGVYAKTVERGLRYLIAHQSADGRLGDGYGHGIATIALCEAYGLTADPQLKTAAQRAINCCCAWQGKNGGFRYTPRMEGDTSVSGWFVQALKSGQLCGLNIPRKTWEGIDRYLDAVAGGEFGETYGYTGPGEGSMSMTAVGLLCREYTGWGPRTPGLQRGIELLQQRPPGSDADIYYFYYATQVVHHAGGAAWEAWNPLMRDQLIDQQDRGTDPKAPHQKGSWTSRDGKVHGGDMGRHGITALSLLTLEVYYRYLPLYRRDLGTDKSEPSREAW